MRDKLYISFLPLRQKTLFANQGSYTLTGQSVGLTYFAIEPEVTAFLTAISVPNDGTIYYSGTAYEITGAELWTALDTCTKDMKTAIGLSLGTNNLSTKFKYIYPRIGGTATAHRYNLVTGTADGTYNGGWTHDGSGALPNGSTGYFDTGIQYTIANLVPADSSYGFISKTNNSGTYVDLGVLTGGFGNIVQYGRNASNLMSTRCNTSGGNNTQSTSTSLGLLSMSRNNSSTYTTYIDGVAVGTITDASASYGGTSYDIYECTFNNTGAVGGQYSPRKRTWSFAGSAMTSTQMGNFYTALATFETTLNR